MAPVYFCSFVLASQFVLVNVVVAVLMKQLEEAKDTESDVNSIQENLDADLDARNNNNSHYSERSEGEEIESGDNESSSPHDGERSKMQINSSRQQRQDPVSSDSSSSTLTLDETNENSPLLRQRHKHSNSSINKNENNQDTKDGTSISDDDSCDNKSHSSKQQNNCGHSDRNSGCSDNPVATPNEDQLEKNSHINTETNPKHSPSVETKSCKDVANDRFNALVGLDYSDLDLEATMEALNGMRDSVISTCV